MAYNRTFWMDHVTEFSDRFRETDNGDGTISHEPVEGEVVQQGTPQNARNFNTLEEGTFSAKAAGRCWGNPGIERPAEADDYAVLWREKKISLEEIGRRLGVSRSTAYRFVKFDKNCNEKFGENDDRKN